MSSSENTSFGGIELGAGRGPRGGTVVDITFEEKGGQRFTFNEIPLRRIPVNAGGAAWQLQEECYALQDAENGDLSVSEWFRIVMKNHPMHRRVTASNFLICPAGGDSVVLKFLVKREVYSDVKLTHALRSRVRRIEPGRYLMLKNDSNRFENLVNMEVHVTGDALGKRAADLIFFHRIGDKYVVRNMHLTSLRPWSRLIPVLGTDIDDRCYGFDDRSQSLWSSSKIEVSDQFACLRTEFGGDLKALRKHNAAICVIDEYSIVFKFLNARTGPIRIREVSLLLDFGNLHMLGDTVIRKGKRGGEDYDDELTPPESKRSRHA
ncbi:hypothetical protein FOZ63_004942 [Perkinsus olseni]|uniref:Uncharacterized protein n=1 Tax=Perkinsus olseni TaxID=32597 RepID=A0A7J6PZK2_PEROL|nr:hypothetical protein FOZ63_004942 [Perkinsus olseni]KAF4712348.1 hypothetical protein FOZ62_008999 [Perkinsus olseni]